ncbi:MAG TPA: hypothetical protein VHE34_19430 [Puia sp.]|uniref:hypothetical protein n=1 Tax=Puia sp. TaxID=2045100 RepID=UPI002CCF5B68|nr:hypothetical protein [Puia sp.]HVU97413.1 hypothetical protein [Puia sp.]
MMMSGARYRNLTLSLFAIAVPFLAFSQQQPEKKKKKFIKEVYASWGYNGEWYTHSTIHVSQPKLGNDYNFVHVKAHDHPGWNEGLFSKALSIPQYNYRLGFLLDEERGWGFEINFDHTKYIFADQNVKLKGTLNGRPADTTIAFNQANGFYYYLNNGANFLLFNVTKKWHVVKTRNEKVKVDFLGKFGVGPVIPHTQNSLFGMLNHQGFQLGGWNTGLEGSLRATFLKYVYLEYSNKIDYARYSGLNVYEGKAHQAFGTYEMILSLGLILPTTAKR